MQQHAVLQQIVSLIKEHKISLRDITLQIQEPPQDFDLLCEVSEKIRLPFEWGKDLNPIGIFPFSDSNQYLELTESSETYRELASENKLPTKDFSERLYTTRLQLNKALITLQKPLLQGSYFVRVIDGRKILEGNWIASFGNDENNDFTCDRFTGLEKSKIRYVGTFMV